MAAVKMTFTLDEATAKLLNEAAAQLQKPKSQVLREAIRDYHGRLDKLSDEERTRLLAVFDKLIARIPPRPAEEIDAELAEIRRARRSGGRRSARRRPR